jgi:hypothetical protein
LYSGAKAVGKEALKTGSNIIADMLNKEPEQPVGSIFKIDLLRQMVTSNKKLKRWLDLVLV